MKQSDHAPDKSKYMYIGNETPYLKGALYQKLASPFNEGDEWKNEGEKLIFAATMDMQHEHHQKYFSKVNFGPMSDIGSVEVSENPGEQGGYIWMGSPGEFEKNFKKVGKWNFSPAK